MRQIFLIVCCLLITLPAYAPKPSTAQTTSTPHRIAIRNTNAEFYDTVTDEKFVPRGVNYFYLVSTTGGQEDRFFGVDVFDEERVRDDFEGLAEARYNTVRIFLDTCSSGTGCMGNPDGPGLNPPYLDNIVRTMEIAAENGLYLLLTSNDLPDQGGYWDISNRGANEFFEGYRNAHYLTSEGHQSAERYWTDLMDGLIERNAPFEVVLGWSLLNEQWYFAFEPPLSLTSGIVTTADGETYDLADADEKSAMLTNNILLYIERLQMIIHNSDPDALVTMGFFHPDNPNPAREGDFKFVETKPLLENAPLDFFDFHAYPGVELNMDEYTENFGMLDYTDKPIIMGEVGAFTHSYETIEQATRAIQQWIAESCEVGFDGWLYWGMYRPSPPPGDATWDFQDADGLMMNALSPLSNPDPCHPTLISTGNLALERPVTASRFLPEEPPSQAVDGGPAQWGSGDYVPQWIEIDLETPAAVGEVRLRIAQYPASDTHHQVWAILDDDQRVLMADFRGFTSDDEILTVTLSPALENVRYVHVETLASVSWVSWKEIEVVAGESGDDVCLISADSNINLRTEPSTDSALAGSLAAGRYAIVDRQMLGADGFVWWRIPDGIWVRSDVGQAVDVATCEDVPTIQ